jgi:hypothetical protein
LIKNIKYLFVFLAIFIAKYVYPQAPNWSWLKTGNSAGTEYISDVAYSSINDSIYVCGSITNNVPSWGLGAVGGGDAFFSGMKESNGAVGFSKVIAGPGFEAADAIAIDANGDVYVTGRFNGTTDFDPGPATANLVSSGQDIFIAKYKRDGTYIWAVKAGGAGADAGLGIFADANGVYVTGSTNGSAIFNSTNATTITRGNHASNNIFCAEYNLNGVVQWVANAESINNDSGYDIVADATNVYLIADYSNALSIYDGSNNISGSLSNQGNTGDIAIIAYNQSGGYAWSNNISSGSIDRGRGITADANLSILLPHSAQEHLLQYQQPIMIFLFLN